MAQQNGDDRCIGFDEAQIDLLSRSLTWKFGLFSICILKQIDLGECYF